MYLELRDVWKSYRNQQIPAVRGVSFTVRSERITALAGESGSGKTTLLRLIAGLERPDRGTIRNGTELFSGPGVFMPAQKRSVAMIFQDLALFPHLTAAANVAFGMKNVSRHDRGRRAESLLRSVGLDGFALEYPHELSGGQRQRVALARALASEANTILMDEPFSNLDPELKRRMMDEVRVILTEARKTVLFVTHDHEEAFTLADDIAVIEDGKLLQYGDAAAVYRSPVNHAVARFFGPVNRIPASVRGAGTFRESPRELLVRPERFRIERRSGGGDKPSDSARRFAGTIRVARFMGEYWEIEVTPESDHPIGGGRLIVREKRPRKPGEAVWVVLPEHEASAIPSPSTGDPDSAES